MYAVSSNDFVRFLLKLDNTQTAEINRKEETKNEESITCLTLATSTGKQYLIEYFFYYICG